MTLSRHSQLSLFILPMLLVAVIFVALALPDFALAQTAPTAAQTQTWMEWILWSIVSGVFGGLTYLTGMLLDWTILNLVLNFGSLFQSSGLGLAVNSLWSVVRDIFNLTFIFGLIFIGFQLILKSDSSSARRGIINLIIAALMVNFSLFITKTVIDFSNIAAVQIARVIYTNTNNSISLQFANQMGIATVWQREGQTGGTNAPTTGYLYIFGSMIVFCVAAFSFATGAVLLFTRFIVLNFMMILSPIMFLGKVFSPLQSYSDKYLSYFLNQCFFAPAFLLMVYFSLYILGTFTGMITRSASISAALTGAGNASVGGLAGLLIGAGFLVGSVMVANKMGAHGASAAMKFGNTVAGKARSMAVGTAMLPVRGAQAAGRYGARSASGFVAGKMEKYNNSLQSTRTGRNIKRAVSAASLGSFTERERLATIESLNKAKYGGTYSAKDDKDFAKQTAARTKVLTDQDDLKAKITTLANAGGAASDDQKVETERAIASANPEQITKLLTNKGLSAEQRNVLIGSLSANQYDTAMKTKEDEITQADKDKIADTRRSLILASLSKKGTEAGATSDPIKAGISKATPDQLKVLGSKNLIEHASGLTLSQIDDIKKNNNFGDTERELIIKAHEKGLQDRYNANPAEFFSKIKGSDIVKLPKAILVAHAPSLTFSQIDDIKKNNEMNDVTKKEITDLHSQALRSSAQSNPATFFANLKAEDAAKIPVDILKNPFSTPHLTPNILNGIKLKTSKEDRDIIKAQINRLYPGTPTQGQPGNKIKGWLDGPQGETF